MALVDALNEKAAEYDGQAEKLDGVEGKGEDQERFMELTDMLDDAGTKVEMAVELVSKAESDYGAE